MIKRVLRATEKEALGMKSQMNATVYSSFDTPGKFHKWGYDCYEGEDGNFAQYTVAIVELENGTVKLVEAHNLLFIDKI